jgi:hypothetical protein
MLLGRTGPEFCSSATDTAAGGLDSELPRTPEVREVIGAKLLDDLQEAAKVKARYETFIPVLN